MTSATAGSRASSFPWSRSRSRWTGEHAAAVDRCPGDRCQTPLSGDARRAPLPDGRTDGTDAATRHPALNEKVQTRRKGHLDGERCLTPISDDASARGER
jgi:hypothetical protein